MCLLAVSGCGIIDKQKTNEIVIDSWSSLIDKVYVLETWNQINDSINSNNLDNLKLNEEGNVIFQELPEWKEFWFVAWNWPQYSIFNNEAINLVPDYYSGISQIFTINKLIRIYISTTNPITADKGEDISSDINYPTYSDWTDITMFDYDLNIAYQMGDEIMSSEHITWQVFLNNRIHDSKTFNIKMIWQYYIIQAPSALNNILLFEFIKWNSLSTNQAFQKITSTEKEKWNFINCDIWLVEDKLLFTETVRLYVTRAKSKCWVMEWPQWDVYEKAIYERDPSINYFKYIWTGKIDN